MSKVLSEVQFGACSAVTIIGYEDERKLITSQKNSHGVHEGIDFDIFQAARHSNLKPSSPKGRSYFISESTESIRSLLSEAVKYENVVTIFTRQLEDHVRDNCDETAKGVTNLGIPYYTGKSATLRLLDYLNKAKIFLTNCEVDSDLKNKLFSLKMQLLRKSMLLGTKTFNRAEIASGVRELYQIGKEKRFQELYEGFLKSSRNFRGIIRELYRCSNWSGQIKQDSLKVISMFQEAISFEEDIIKKFLFSV